MEASVLKLQEFLQLKVMESDEKSKLLFEEIASDMALEGFSFEVRQLRALAQLQLLVPALCNILCLTGVLSCCFFSFFNFFFNIYFSMRFRVGFLLQGLEELWNMIHQESSNRKKWVRAMDESLKEIERSRAVKVS